MTTDDYFIVIQLARRKNMTRSQFVMDCIRQVILKEQEEWKRQEEEKRILEKVKAGDPRPQWGEEEKR
jgi:metal-responsive CopG/Arc/MetJ family transcriptional regulator